MTMSTGREALPDVACRVCSGALRHKWTMKVLDRYDADYFECLRCGCLQIPKPHWLAEAYRDEGNPIAVNPDTGRFIRNFSAYVRLRALEYAGLFGGPLRVLDYGGGSGLLAAMLWLANCKCRQFDPYCRVPMFAPELAFATQEEIPTGGFNVVASLEVFEHLCDPLDVIRTLARYVEPTGAIVLSTGLYKPNVHTNDWPYLSRLAGQHVTFYTRKAIRILADVAGFPNICLFPSDDGFLIVLTRLRRSQADRCLQKAINALESPSLLVEWTSGAWDIRHHTGATICLQPVFVE
jgi:SAM-dependent methyltransferase